MKKLLQNLISFISFFIILAFIAYGILWFCVSKEMTRTLDSIWAHQADYLITINGAQPSVTGFPGRPKVVFSGSVTDRNGLVYAAPEFIYRGFTLPTQSITLEAPKGLDFSGPVFKAKVHLDQFLLTLRIPADYPRKLDIDTLTFWQKNGGKLPIEKLKVLRGSLMMEGDGYLTLDTDLQPEGLITVQVSGLDDLVNEFVQNKTISANQALMAQSLINLMSSKDEKTGTHALTTGIHIQQGGVFIGPLRVASLPEWKWDKN